MTSLITCSGVMLLWLWCPALVLLVVLQASLVSWQGPPTIGRLGRCRKSSRTPPRPRFCALQTHSTLPSSLHFPGHNGAHRGCEVLDVTGIDRPQSVRWTQIGIRRSCCCFGRPTLCNFPCLDVTDVSTFLSAAGVLRLAFERCYMPAPLDPIGVNPVLGSQAFKDFATKGWSAKDFDTWSFLINYCNT